MAKISANGARKLDERRIPLQGGQGQRVLVLCSDGRVLARVSWRDGASDGYHLVTRLPRSGETEMRAAFGRLVARLAPAG